MKSIHWLVLFIVNALLHLATTVYYLPTLNIISKPLLMVFLAGYFVSFVGNHNNKLRIIIIIALVCSWFGDTFLMFQNNNPVFFILGLGSFLLAHIAYIIVFIKFNRSVSNKESYLIIILFVAYSLVLSYVLWSGLGEMKIPVIVYALVITLMGITGFIRNWRVNNSILVGAVLFIISDSLIAYTKFVEPVGFGDLLIMSTYILAQFLLVSGLSKRIQTDAG